MKLLTFNVRGLRQNVKRRALFHYLHVKYPAHIVVLQETHSKLRDIPYWKAEWGADIFCAHGTSSNECGVAVLMPRTLDCKFTQTYSDDDGRMLSIDIEVGASKLSLIAVYSPTQGHVEEQVKFFHLLQSRLGHIPVNANQSIVLCGDFNAHLSRLDSDSSRFRRNRASRLLENILAEFSLKDVWRIHHSHIRQYTWRR